MKFMILKAIVGVVIMLSGCSGNSLKQYSDTTPKVDLKEYFNGPIEAWGIVQDWRGRIVSRFDVRMEGTWEGNTGKLTEWFHYYDGTRQKRVWTIKKQSDGNYEGTASDIIGKATGETSGSAARWNYVMNLPVNGTTYRIRFDDWMWMMNDGVLINRSYLRKFGITVAELTLFLKKKI